MKALVLNEANPYPALQDVPDPIPQQGEVVVDIKAAALNHRDVWITKGKYPGIQYPVILGSDGAGLLGGKPVVVQPGMEWGPDERFQGKQYHILGTPKNGTFSQKLLVDREQVFAMPPHLDLIEAAALPLAGLTAYRALFTRCQAQAGEKLLITGIGGGVALACLQFAVAIGMEVFVTSSADEKISRAVDLGAKGGANYRDSAWNKSLQKAVPNGFDVIIDSAGGEGFQHLVKLCAPGGRMGIYGGTKGTITDISPQLIFWRQISILGSTMGSDKDFAEMLAFVEAHAIRPVIDSVHKMETAEKAFSRMAAGEQFGKNCG
jgi:NADPH:quinone reductase-like Zn-dependent oxidoreductase